jgi:hypothetical protein
VPAMKGERGECIMIIMVVVIIATIVINGN